MTMPMPRRTPILPFFTIAHQWACACPPFCWEPAASGGAAGCACRHDGAARRGRSRYLLAALCQLYQTNGQKDHLEETSRMKGPRPGGNAAARNDPDHWSATDFHLASAFCTANKSRRASRQGAARSAPAVTGIRPASSDGTPPFNCSAPCRFVLDSPITR